MNSDDEAVDETRLEKSKRLRDPEFMQMFSDLSDVDGEVRLKATNRLVAFIAKKQTEFRGEGYFVFAPIFSHSFWKTTSQFFCFFFCQVNVKKYSIRWIVWHEVYRRIEAALDRASQLHWQR